MSEYKNITDKERQDSVRKGAIILINIVIILIVLSVLITYRYTNNRYKQFKQELVYAIAGDEGKYIDIFKIEKTNKGKSLISIRGEE